MEKKQKVIMSVINDLSGDQRIHRIATALTEADFEVLVVGKKITQFYSALRIETTKPIA